jgi:hypothetical protein
MTMIEIEKCKVGTRVELTEDYAGIQQRRRGTLATWTPGGGPEVVLWEKTDDVAVQLDTLPRDSRAYPFAIPRRLLRELRPEEVFHETLIRLGLEAYDRAWEEIDPPTYTNVRRGGVLRKHMSERMAQAAMVYACDIREGDPELKFREAEDRFAELNRSTSLRQAALETLGKAIGECIPDARATGDALEHATSIGKQLVTAWKAALSFRDELQHLVDALGQDDQPRRDAIARAKKVLGQ